MLIEGIILDNGTTRVIRINTKQITYIDSTVEFESENMIYTHVFLTGVNTGKSFYIEKEKVARLVREDSQKISDLTY